MTEMKQTAKEAIQRSMYMKQIIAAYGTSLQMSREDGSCVTVTTLPRAQARALVAELRAAGHEASDAPDNDDPRLAWVYVTE